MPTMITLRYQAVNQVSCNAVRWKSPGCVALGVVLAVMAMTLALAALAYFCDVLGDSRLSCHNWSSRRDTLCHWMRRTLRPLICMHNSPSVTGLSTHTTSTGLHSSRRISAELELPTWVEQKYFEAETIQALDSTALPPPEDYSGAPPCSLHAAVPGACPQEHPPVESPEICDLPPTARETGPA